MLVASHWHIVECLIYLCWQNRPKDSDIQAWKQWRRCWQCCPSQRPWGEDAPAGSDGSTTRSWLPSRASIPRPSPPAPASVRMSRRCSPAVQTRWQVSRGWIPRRPLLQIKIHHIFFFCIPGLYVPGCWACRRTWSSPCRQVPPSQCEQTGHRWRQWRRGPWPPTPAGICSGRPRPGRKCVPSRRSSPAPPQWHTWARFVCSSFHDTKIIKSLLICVRLRHTRSLCCRRWRERWRRRGSNAPHSCRCYLPYSILVDLTQTVVLRVLCMFALKWRREIRMVPPGHKS